MTTPPAPADQLDPRFVGARTVPQVSDALRRLAGYLGFTTDKTADPDTPEGTITVSPELRIVGHKDEQNALVMDTEDSQSTVIHIRRAGVLIWQIVAHADAAAPLQINAFSGGAAQPVLTINRATGVVDFAQPPTVQGAPI